MFSAIGLLLCACRSSQPGPDGSHDSSSSEDDSDTPVPDDSSGGDDSGTLDHDGDGWIEPDDCDDDDFSVHPDAIEACVDQEDNDCDGVVDHCDLDREPHVEHRFVDPDADGWKTDGDGGFGWWMGFLDNESPGLWISPQYRAKDPLWREAWASGWSPAEVSGFTTFEDDERAYSMVETHGDFDADGVHDLVLAEWMDERITAHLFYDPVVVTQSRDAASASVVAEQSTDLSRWSEVVAVGDQTGDAWEDLLLVCWYGTSSIVAGPIVGDLDVSSGEDALVPVTVSEVWSATALDFDGDGVEDLAIGNPVDAQTGAFQIGGAYVYLGPAAGTLEPTVADVAWSGSQTAYPERLGPNIDSGDLDGDGRDEVIVRSFGYHLESQPGVVYVLDQDASDGAEAAAVARAQIEGNPWDDLGSTRGDIADFDHDARSDLVVSAMQHYPDAKGNGYAAVFLGPLDGHLTADTDANLTLRGSADDWGSGISTVAGDLDGDGELDLAIGGMMYDHDDGYKVWVVDVLTPALLFGA